MIDLKKAAAAAILASAALAASGLSASAQSSLTNGPNGNQPNTLSSDSQTGINGNSPSRGIYRQNRGTGHRSTAMRRKHSMAEPRAAMHTSYAYRRPLTVRRTVAAEPALVPPPAPVVAGPGTLVTGPLGVASNVFTLPFRVLNGIFPATGDVASNPLVIIGAPIHAIGDIVQVPLRVLGAPFGGTTIATY